jgi:hypothetical protein
LIGDTELRVILSMLATIAVHTGQILLLLPSMYYCVAIKLTFSLVGDTELHTPAPWTYIGLPE